MSITKRALLALGGTFAFATAARAQSQGSNQAADALLDQQAVYIDSTGKMSRLTLNSAGDAAMKKNGQLVEGPAILYRQGGKHYLVNGNTVAAQIDSYTSNRQAVGTM